jgi:drug/metabolite transporter (DMT)-like permease
MTLAAILLLVSALLHAAWNLRGKDRHATVASLFVTTLLGTLSIAPVLIWHGSKLATVPAHVWQIVPWSGLALALYYAALANAYRVQDMSSAYPLARSLPVLFVPCITVPLGLGQMIGPVAWVGFAMTLAGAFILPWKHLKDIHWRHYIAPSYLWAVGAAIGTTAYSILDDRAVRALQAEPDWSSGSAAAVYMALEAASCSVWMAAFVAVSAARRAHALATFRKHAVHAAVTGFMIYLSYGLVLAAMTFAANVGYIVAFRQLSIPMGVIGGILILKENCPPPRAVGVAIMCAGLALVAIG